MYVEQQILGKGLQQQHGNEEVFTNTTIIVQLMLLQNKEDKMSNKKGSCGNKPRVGKVGDRKGQGMRQGNRRK